jgi:hypothetical protein
MIPNEDPLAAAKGMRNGCCAGCLVWLGVACIVVALVWGPYLVGLALK